MVTGNASNSSNLDKNVGLGIEYDIPTSLPFLYTNSFSSDDLILDKDDDFMYPIPVLVPTELSISSSTLFRENVNAPFDMPFSSTTEPEKKFDNHDECNDNSKVMLPSSSLEEKITQKSCAQSSRTQSNHLSLRDQDPHDHDQKQNSLSSEKSTLKIFEEAKQSTFNGLKNIIYNEQTRNVPNLSSQPKETKKIEHESRIHKPKENKIDPTRNILTPSFFQNTSQCDQSKANSQVSTGNSTLVNIQGEKQSTSKNHDLNKDYHRNKKKLLLTPPNTHLITTQKYMKLNEPCKNKNDPKTTEIKETTNQSMYNGATNYCNASESHTIPPKKVQKKEKLAQAVVIPAVNHNPIDIKHLTRQQNVTLTATPSPDKSMATKVESNHQQQQRLPATILSETQAPGLPLGWMLQRKQRSGGKSAGNIDRYWFSPQKRIKFRSMVEVKLFFNCLARPEVEGNEDRAYSHYKVARGNKNTHVMPQKG